MYDWKQLTSVVSDYDGQQLHQGHLNRAEQLFLTATKTEEEILHRRDPPTTLEMVRP